MIPSLVKLLEETYRNKWTGFCMERTVSARTGRTGWMPVVVVGESRQAVIKEIFASDMDKALATSFMGDDEKVDNPRFGAYMAEPMRTNTPWAVDESGDGMVQQLIAELIVLAGDDFVYPEDYPDDSDVIIG